jgi:hypothetical protein
MTSLDEAHSSAFPSPRPVRPINPPPTEAEKRRQEEIDCVKKSLKTSEETIKFATIAIHQTLRKVNPRNAQKIPVPGHSSLNDLEWLKAELEASVSLEKVFLDIVHNLEKLPIHWSVTQSLPKYFLRAQFPDTVTIIHPELGFLPASYKKDYCPTAPNADSLKYHMDWNSKVRSPYVSTSSSPGHIFKIFTGKHKYFPKFKDEDGQVFLIDGAEMKRCNVDIQPSTELSKHFKALGAPDLKEFVTDMDWLVDGHIPQSCVVASLSGDKFVDLCCRKGITHSKLPHCSLLCFLCSCMLESYLQAHLGSGTGYLIFSSYETKLTLEDFESASTSKPAKEPGETGQGDDSKELRYLADGISNVKLGNDK